MMSALAGRLDEAREEPRLGTVERVELGVPLYTDRPGRGVVLDALDQSLGIVGRRGPGSGDRGQGLMVP